METCNAGFVVFLLAAAISVINNILLMLEFEQIIKLDLMGFLKIFLISVVLWLVFLLTNTIGEVVQARAVRALNNSYRQDLTKKLTHKTHNEFHQEDIGEHLSSFTNDVNQVENLAWKPFFDLINQIFVVAFSIVALLTLHWSLLVISLLAAVVIINAPKLVEKKLTVLGERCAEEQGVATGQMKEMLTGFDLLKAFGKMSVFRQRSAEVSDDIEAPKFRLEKSNSVYGGLLGVISVVCQVLVNAFIAYLSIKGIIIQSALMGGGNICATIYNGLGSIISIKLSFASAKPYFDKVADGEASEETARMLPELSEGIKVEKLSFAYQEQKPIFTDADFKFSAGKKYALVGPSGCGKSTLFNMIIGWLRGYKGHIFYDKEDIEGLTEDELQTRIGYIEQNAFVFSNSIRENITLGDDFSDEDIEKALKDSSLYDDITKMPDGLDTQLGEDGRNVSGGQKQRIAIARALLHRKSVLLMDEGTSALDKKNVDAIEGTLLKNRDLTLILVSHHLSDERKSQFDKVYDLGAAR